MRRRPATYAQHDQRGDGSEADDGVHRVGVLDVAEDLVPRFDEALGLDVQSQQVLDLRRGDGHGRRRREAGDDGRRDELDEETKVEQAQTQHDAAAQEGQHRRGRDTDPAVRNRRRRQQRHERRRTDRHRRRAAQHHVHETTDERRVQSVLPHDNTTNNKPFVSNALFGTKKSIDQRLRTSGGTPTTVA